MDSSLSDDIRLSGTTKSLSPASGEISGDSLLSAVDHIHSLGVIHRRDARYTNITGMVIHDDILFVADGTDLRAINIGNTPRTVMTRSLSPDFTRFVGSSTVGDGFLTVDPTTGDLYTARQSSHEITKIDGTSGQVSLFAGQAFQIG